MDAYERNVDKALNTVEKVGNTANRIYIGCATILTNLCIVAFCLWGVVSAYNTWQLQTNGETTTGIVTKLESQSDGDGGCCTFVPIVEYTVNGQVYTIEGNVASDPPQYHVGEQVSVLYDPADPSRAQIDRGFEKWFFPIIIIPAMIFTFLIVNITLWIRLRSKKTDF